MSSDSVALISLLLAVITLLFGDGLIKHLNPAAKWLIALSFLGLAGSFFLMGKAPSGAVSGGPAPIAQEKAAAISPAKVVPDPPEARSTPDPKPPVDTPSLNPQPPSKTEEEAPAPAKGGKPPLPIKQEFVSATITRGSRLDGYGIALRLRLSGAPTLVRPFIANGGGEYGPISAAAMNGNECRFMRREGGIPYMMGEDDVLRSAPSAPPLEQGSSTDIILYADCDKPIFPGTAFSITGNIFYFVDEWAPRIERPWKMLTYTLRDVILR